ncbi:Kynurenine--oxoglutarate transaminase 3-like protein, partial [Leptotrombidium deliense]
GYENEYENFNQPSSYFYRFANSLQEKRDLLAKILSEVHLKAVIPDAGVFEIVDFSELANKINFTSEEGDTKDIKFVNWFSNNRKLQAVPFSIFFTKQHRYISENFVRMTFARGDETFEAVRRIVDDLKELLNEE